MQKRTSPLKFGDLAEKSGMNSVSNLEELSILLSPPGERGAAGAASPEPVSPADAGS